MKEISVFAMSAADLLVIDISWAHIATDFMLPWVKLDGYSVTVLSNVARKSDY